MVPGEEHPLHVVVLVDHPEEDHQPEHPEQTAQGPPLLGLLLWRDHNGSGHAIARIKMQQADALRVAAGFADLAVRKADDLSVLADEHAFRIFFYLHDRHHLTVAFRGLDVDHTFTAAIY